jgi:hypothetical protein
MGAFRHLDAAPGFKPGVHHVDLGLLRGLDLLGEGLYLGIDAALAEHHVAHVYGLFVMRNHHLHKHHISFVEFADWSGARGRGRAS